jgi:hypothetical protein
VVIGGQHQTEYTLFLRLLLVVEVDLLEMNLVLVLEVD